VRHKISENGFSFIELLVAVGLIGVLAAASVPFTSRTVGDLRMHGDARAIHNMVGLAKMRAGTRFTRERMYVDLTTESFFLQYWDKTAAAWVTEGGATALSSGVDFGFGTLATPPPNTQPVINQAPACLLALTAGNNIANTACVMFNSRGIPVDAVGAPVGNIAFYVTDHQTGVYGVTVSATPLVRLWWSPASTTHWAHK
jgi:prepilin-type N-terminal cleavage/methylation domain-containing protein